MISPCLVCGSETVGSVGRRVLNSPSSYNSLPPKPFFFSTLYLYTAKNPQAVSFMKRARMHTETTCLILCLGVKLIHRL